MTKLVENNHIINVPNPARVVIYYPCLLQMQFIVSPVNDRAWHSYFDRTETRDVQNTKVQKTPKATTYISILCNP